MARHVAGTMLYNLDLHGRYARGDHLVVTARRGLAAHYPENTMLAFNRAVALGVDSLWIDVRGTRDHVPIALHDATLDRTTDATGSPNDYRFADLRRVNASHWSGPPESGHRSSEPACAYLPIPSLEEVIDTLGHRVCFHLRLHEVEPPLVTHISRFFHDLVLHEQAVLTVATRRQAALVRSIDATIPLCVLEAAGDESGGERHRVVSAARATPALAVHARQMGIAVDVKHVNEREEMHRLLDLGFRGFVTDRPDLALEVAREREME